MYRKYKEYKVLYEVNSWNVPKKLQQANFKVKYWTTTSALSVCQKLQLEWVYFIIVTAPNRFPMSPGHRPLISVLRNISPIKQRDERTGTPRTKCWRLCEKWKERSQLTRLTISATEVAGAIKHQGSTLSPILFVLIIDTITCLAPYTLFYVHYDFLVSYSEPDLEQLGLEIPSYNAVSGRIWIKPNFWWPIPMKQAFCIYQWYWSQRQWPS